MNSDNNLNVDYLDGEPENYCLEVVPYNPIVKEPLIKSRINAVCTSCLYIFRQLAVEEYGNEACHRAYNVERIKMSALSRAQYSQMKSAYRGNFASNADAISISDLFSLVKQYDKEFNPKPVNPLMLNDNGTPRVFFHQTKNDFTIFNTNNERAGQYDSDTPTGMFFKTTDKNIGLAGKNKCLSTRKKRATPCSRPEPLKTVLPARYYPLLSLLCHKN